MIQSQMGISICEIYERNQNKLFERLDIIVGNEKKADEEISQKEMVGRREAKEGTNTLHLNRTTIFYIYKYK